jgi:hypothetical protein
LGESGRDKKKDNNDKREGEEVGDVREGSKEGKGGGLNSSR